MSKQQKQNKQQIRRKQIKIQATTWIPYKGTIIQPNQQRWVDVLEGRRMVADRKAIIIKDPLRKSDDGEEEN